MSRWIVLRALRPDGHGLPLCYPRYSHDELRRRLSELRKLGVVAVSFQGEVRVDNVRVLGKGHSSVILAARLRGGSPCVLKVRRVDAGRSDLSHEAEMLKLTNSQGVGPLLYAHSPNFLAMSWVKGKPLPLWLKGLRGRKRRTRLRAVLLDALDQCRALDRRGLDHGELSRAPKHILIDAGDRVHLLDFGKASVQRRTSNVTSLAQYLLIGGDVAPTIRRLLKPPPTRRMIQALAAYKREPSDERFQELTTHLRLRPGA